MIVKLGKVLLLSATAIVLTAGTPSTAQEQGTVTIALRVAVNTLDPHMSYVDGPRLARVLDSGLIGSLAVICPACWCSRA